MDLCFEKDILSCYEPILHHHWGSNYSNPNAEI